MISPANTDSRKDSSRKDPKSKPKVRERKHPYLTTLIFLGCLAFALCILAAWAIDIAPVSYFFTQLHQIENELPLLFRSLLYPDRYSTFIVIGLFVGLRKDFDDREQPNK